MVFRNVKILQIHNVQTHRGGADAVIDREADLLRSRGHEVVQWFIETQKELSKSKVGAAFKAIWNREACRSISRLVAAECPDVAHVHTPFPLLSPAVFRKLHQLKIPTVVTLHSHRMVCVNALLQRNGQPCEDCVGHKVPWPAIRHRCYHNSLVGSCVMAGSLALHHAAGTFANCIDRYIALSDFARQRLIRTGFPDSKIIVRPNFVPESPGPGSGESNNVVFVGRLVAEKGILTVLKAWKLLENPPELVVIGDGPLRESLERASSGRNIRFTGWLQPSQVSDLMAKAALVVFPSEIYEAGPLVLLEAYSRGTPVLASDIGNFSDQVIEDVTGKLFRTGDAKHLAAKVSSLFETPSLLTQLRPGAYEEYQQKYTPGVSYERLMSIYSDVISERSAGLNQRI